MRLDLEQLVARIPGPVRTLVATLRFRNINLLYRLPGFTERVARCPICAGQSTYEAKNITTELDRCLTCGHVYARRLPGDRILHLKYGKLMYWQWDKVHQGITEIAPGPQWQGYLGARVGILRRAGILTEAPSNRLRFFEIGCSEGMLLAELKRLGHEAEGCEMNAAIAEAGRRALGVTIAPVPFERMDIPPASFDAVLSFHTIEHVRSPADVLRRATRILTPEGALLVEVPCGPEEYPNTDHLHFFSRESLECLLARFFTRVEIIENAYENPDGVRVMSLYGVGRDPRRGAAVD